MSDLSERKRFYEIHTLRAERWTVVDVHEYREEALTQAAGMRGLHEGVRVIIEHFDADRGTYVATTIWEWLAPRRRGPRYQGVSARPEPFRPQEAPIRPPPPKPWWRRWLGR